MWTAAQGLYALVMLGVTGLVALISLHQSRQFSRSEGMRAAREWQSVAEAMEERVKALESKVVLLEAQAEANAALISQAQSEARKAQEAEKDAARRNLRLQRDLETANRRIGQLEELCRRAGVDMPVGAAGG